MRMTTSRMWMVVLLLGTVAGTAPAGMSRQSADAEHDLIVARLKTKLFAHAARQHDCFGRSLFMNGDRIIAGAKGDDERGSNSGAAYIFRRAGTEWIEEAKLKASDARTNDFFGFSVGLSGDTALVGAWQQDEKANGAGAAYVFRRQGDGWVQEAKLTARDGRPFAQFGYAVALDGDVAVIGARQDGGKADRAGAAYIFRRVGATWTQQARLVANDVAAGDQFGGSVAIEGGTVAIGAPGNDGGGTDAGAVYVFRQNGSGWKQDAKMVASNALPSDALGYSLAMSQGTIVAGAYLSDTADSDTGAAYVFARVGTEWAQVQQLTPRDAIANEWFGWSVGVDGGTIVVGAWYDTHGSDKEGPFGSAYVYKRQGAKWTEASKLVSSAPNPFDLFGWTVAVRGNTIAVGARLDDGAALEGGAVYVHSY